MKVNGQQISLEKSKTLRCYLEENSYRVDTIAVELNGSIVPKASYDLTELSEDAVLEIMHFVGGG